MLCMWDAMQKYLDHDEMDECLATACSIVPFIMNMVLCYGLPLEQALRNDNVSHTNPHSAAKKSSHSMTGSRSRCRYLHGLFWIYA